jgi:DNA-binding beta-propeller fold protein YncE
MRQLLAVGLVLLALPAGGAARTGGGTPVGIVTTAHGARVLAVEAWTGAVLGSLQLGAPGGAVAATFDGRRVLVASPAAGTVTLVDMRTPRVLARFRGLGKPVDVEITPDGRRGFVAERRTGTLAVLDLVHRRLAARVAVGARPSAIAESDFRVWVAHDSAARELSVVDAAPGRPPRALPPLPAGGAAATLRHLPDSAWLVLTYRGSGDVAKLDAGPEGRVVFRRRAGTRVAAVGVDWSTTRLWAADGHGRIAVLDSRTGARRGARDAGAAVIRLDDLGGFMVATTPRDLRLLVPGRPGRTVTRVPGGIADAAFAVF